MPINWRNVDSRGTNGAGQLLDGAREAINDGLGSFRNILRDRKATQVANLDNQRDLNNQTYLDKLASITTPEALAENRNQLDELAASLGPNVDPNIIRDGYRDRLTDLRSEATTDYNYDTTLATREAQPIMERIQAQMAEGDTEGGLATLKENQSVLSRAGEFGNLATSLDNRARTLLDRERADEDYTYTIEGRDSQDAANTLLREAILNSASPEEARAYIQSRADEEGIRSADLTDAITNLPMAYESHHGISPHQQQEIDMVTQGATIEAEDQRRRAESAWGQIREQYQVDPRFTFQDGDRKKLGDSVSLAEEQGWDKTGLSAKIRGAKDNFIRKRQDNGRPLTTQELNNLDNVLHMSVAALGSENHLIPFTTGNLPTDVLEEELEKNWDHFMQNEGNRKQLIEGEKMYNQAMTTADQTYAGRVNAALNHFKNQNQGLRELARTQRQQR